MRELKFRSWSLLGLRFWYFDIHTGFNAENSDCFPTVDQYTGLKDKNGVEIYEGDVVMCKVTIQVDDDSKEFSYYNSHDDGSKTKHCCKPKPCKVLIENGVVNYIHISGARCTAWLEKSNDLEVIGNIYENPELIK